MELLLPPNLDVLEVLYCQELRELPILPPSLLKLCITHARLTTLPMIGKISSESIEITPSQLLYISVTDCPFLTSLEGSLFEQKLYIGALRYLEIRNCVHLESASIPFQEMGRLEVLDISSCPKLRTTRDAKNKLLPSSLTHLTMWQCGDLELPVFGVLQRLTNLSLLWLENSSRLVSLPSAEVFNTSLKSLRWLQLSECENLSSLGGLGSLGYLTIRNCSKLVAAGLSLAADESGGQEEHLVNPGSCLQIDCLQIDSPSLLLVEPLKSLCHTKEFQIGDVEMKSLPEGWLLQNHPSLRSLEIYQAKSLESLPPSMPGLSSLEVLDVSGAEKLRSLPDLPSSLEVLEIPNCHPDLEKKMRELASPERKKICHIPRVKIGNARFVMDKECSEDDFEELRDCEHDTLISWADQQKDNKILTWWKKLDCLKNVS